MSGVENKNSLIEKIRNKTAVVGVVGLGYVGLPFAVEKAKVGFKVIGIDRNAERVAKINRGENYIGDVKDEELQTVVASGLISAATSFEVVPELDVIIFCVPTPLTEELVPDLQYVKHVGREVGKHIRPGQLISLESTTYPGTTEEILLPLLSESGLVVEEDFFLCHSPERVDPGNARYTTKNTNKVIGGVGPASLEVGVSFYSQTIDHVVPVSSARAAELTKVFENTFRAVNIALVNELAMLCDRMDLNVWEVLDAANTKPFGIMPFYPGPGVGGHCIPIDPHYLEWKARELGFETQFIALAGHVNRGMPEFVVEKAGRLLQEDGKQLEGARVLVMGAAYKNDIDDWRESPAIDIMKILHRAGAEVVYHDEYVPHVSTRELQLSSNALTEELLRKSDLVIVATAHSTVNYQFLVDHSNKILDTRNATKNLQPGQAKVTLL